MYFFDKRTNKAVDHCQLQQRHSSGSLGPGISRAVNSIDQVPGATKDPYNGQFDTYTMNSIDSLNVIGLAESQANMAKTYQYE
eukprot:Awhi_evm1s14935